MKTPGNARGVPPLVLLQTRLAKCNFRPADVAPLVLLFALALLAAFSALVDAFTRTTVTGRKFPFGSLGNSWSRASSPGQLTVLRWLRWFMWGVWSIASPMSTGRPRGRWRDGVRRRHPNWRARSLWLLEQASQWALLPLLLPLLRRRTPSSLPLIPVLSHPPEQALQTTVAGATKTSNTFLSWSQTYRHTYSGFSATHYIYI